jgi:ankyrin repeat protein
MIYQTVQHSHHALRATVKAAKHDQWLWGSFERLWTLFETIATSNGTTGIIIIIDAIDELEVKTQKQISSRILHFLQFEANSAVKFVITSQPHAFAVTELQSHSTRLALESKQDVIGEDVNLYIVDRLKRLQVQKGWSNGMRERLTQVLQSKADRSFLWVSFTLAFLENRDILDKADLDDAMTQIPPDLTKFYHRFLTSINSRDAPGPALRLLNVVLSSSRPLHVNELAILLSINSSHQSITEVQRDYAIRGIQSIQQALGPLIKLHNSKIQLVHTSSKDHLAEYGSTYGVDETKGHELLAEKCILYLLLQHFRQSSIETVSSSTPSTSPTISLPGRNIELVDDVGSGVPESIFGTIFEEPGALPQPATSLNRPGDELYDYATRFWATHFEQCHPSEGSLLHGLGVDFYTRFSQARWAEHLRLAAGETPDYPTMPDALTIACFYGHDTLLRHFLSGPNVTDVQIGKALYWASSRGYCKCVKMLHSCMKPDFEKSLCNHSGRSPLATAAENGHVDCLDFLLQTHIFDLNQQDTGGYTALSLAAARAQDQIISMLLGLERSYELDVNLADANGRSALFWACSANTTSGVSKLLHDERTNPNLLDRHSRDATSWACQDGLANVVKLFVDNPSVTLSNQDAAGNTPLIYAVKSKDLRTVTALFRRSRRSRLWNASAELNIAAKDAEGRNALSWAASTGDSKILAHLLKYGSSEANVRDINGWPPLAWTMDPPGFPQNAIMLLPHCGNRIHDRDEFGSSLLSTAIRWRQFEIAQVLIEQTDIDVNSKNSAGRTALSFAASSGSWETAKLLLNTRHADPAIADDAGMLPSHWAQVEGHNEIADHLEKVTNAITGAERNL